MKKIFYSFCAVLISLSFMACPYKTSVPLDAEPMQAINQDVLGDYEKKGSSSYTYKVEKSTDNEYKFIRTSTSETSTSKPSEYLGFTSSVDGETYLHMYRKSKYSSKKTYYLYRLSMNYFLRNEF